MFPLPFMAVKNLYNYLSELIPFCIYNQSLFCTILISTECCENANAMLTDEGLYFVVFRALLIAFSHLKNNIVDNTVS